MNDKIKNSISGVFEENLDLKKRKILAQILLPEAKLTIEELKSRYPIRELPVGAMVTRIAPSPTGFMHIGGIYAALISERLAHQSNGVFYLRIEDTDKKREVEGATELIINSLKELTINIDEGEIAHNYEVGEYGPYKQSNRQEIYHSVIKTLIESGDAYPAFETAEELENINNLQVASKLPQGYYGDWATWRNKTLDDYFEALNKNLKPVIRLKTKGDSKKFVNVEDIFKGKLHLPEHDQDIVILKSDGLPTYHFAHIIDDHLMGTTHVIRGDEWLSSLALHIQLFDRFGWTPPTYGHISPIQKIDGASRRKLSKRHDPEASISFYQEAGYPPEAIIIYLLNLANWGFEQWLADHPNDRLDNYKLSIAELKKSSGALLDLQKIDSLSKEFISKLSGLDMYNRVTTWARKYDNELATLMESDADYAINIFNIERGGEKARKDIAKWSDVRQCVGFFFDKIYENQIEKTADLTDIKIEDIKEIVDRVRQEYRLTDNKEEWLDRMKKISISLGYAPDMKTFKSEPEKYKGNFGDMAKIIRILLVGSNKSPDLYEIMQVMGLERIKKRLSVNIF
jgi:glutamyl-tRNA synthetase